MLLTTPQGLRLDEGVRETLSSLASNSTHLEKEIKPRAQQLVECLCDTLEPHVAAMSRIAEILGDAPPDAAQFYQKSYIVTGPKRRQSERQDSARKSARRSVVPDKLGFEDGGGNVPPLPEIPLLDCSGYQIDLTKVDKYLSEYNSILPFLPNRRAGYLRHSHGHHRKFMMEIDDIFNQAYGKILHKIKMIWLYQSGIVQTATCAKRWYTRDDLLDQSSPSSAASAH